MKPTFHHNHHIWPCHFEWLERKMADEQLQTDYEVRGYKNRRFESKNLAVSFANKHRKLCWQVWYIDGKFNNEPLYQELISDKAC